MQSPTPPTKPTPPTPPSMKTSTAAPSTDTQTPATTTPLSINPSKVAPTSKEQSVSVPESNSNNSPPVPFSPSNNTVKETTSQTSIPLTTQLPKKASSAFGFTVFFILILLIALALILVHWWKNYKPKQKSLIDYSTESSDEIVNLILSNDSFKSVPQVIAKKIIPKAEPTPKTKGNFEVRA